VSVCGTDNISLALETFLGFHSLQISPCENFIRSRHYIFRICLEDPPNYLNAYSQNTLKAYRSVIPSDANIRDGILTVCPLSLPFGKDLGPPNPGLTISAQETLGLRWFGFSPNFLLLMPTFSLLCAPPDLTVWLHRTKNAPLPRRCKTSTFSSSVLNLAPVHFRRKTTWSVSCYAFFKGWLLLSQPPDCPSHFTTFYT